MPRLLSNKKYLIAGSLGIGLLLGAIFCGLKLSTDAEDLSKRESLQAMSRLLRSDPGNSNMSDYEVVNIYPHDPAAFTQALVFHEGFLYESTGLRGKSTLRKIELETGKVLKIHRLPEQFFGEGLVLWQDKLIQLTWKSGIGFVYDMNLFQKTGEFEYSTEGWGLTHDGSHLIMSDGSANLRFLNPHTFKEIKRIEVHHEDLPIIHLNELEYIKGEVYANIWGFDYLVRVIPDTGQVIGWVDMTNLRSLLAQDERAGSLNGIAYDARGDRIFVTGKRWPEVFEIKLKPKLPRNKGQVD